MEAPQSEVAISYDMEGLTFAQRVALDPTIDIERLKAVIEMENAAQDRAANKEFEAAFAAMQPELPAVDKKGEGQNSTNYAKLEAIQAAVKPVLAAHGFSYRFKQEDKETGISLTCILSHRSGGSDTDTMRLPYDTGGQKNAVQARGSTVAYGKRYTLCNVLGIQLGGEDNDGKTPPSGEPINADQVKQIRDALAKLGQKDDVILAWAGTRGIGATELENMPAEGFEQTIGQLNHWIKVRGKNNG
jgi:hypothetical protein